MAGPTKSSRKYTVTLNPEARTRLEDLTRNGTAPAKKILHARVLLLSDQEHPAGRYHDHQIAAALGLHVNSVARIRQRFVQHGEQPALERKPRLTPPVAPILDGAAEAALIALCCSPAPPGRGRWTMSLLAQELVGRKIVVRIGRETVRQTLKKTSCGPGGRNASAFPNATRPASSPRWSRCSTPTPNPRTRTSR
jgi:hypothetical protein